jgi:hypothetical protein
LNGTAVWGNTLKVELAEPKVDPREELSNRVPKKRGGCVPE